MTINDWKGTDPHAAWALEGQPDPGPEPAPRMCMYCAAYLSLSGMDAGICDRDFGDWARSWRIAHPNGSWRQAADDAELWVARSGTVLADEDACDGFEEAEGWE